MILLWTQFLRSFDTTYNSILFLIFFPICQLSCKLLAQKRVLNQNVVNKCAAFVKPIGCLYYGPYYSPDVSYPRLVNHWSISE